MTGYRPTFATGLPGPPEPERVSKAELARLKREQGSPSEWLLRANAFSEWEDCWLLRVETRPSTVMGEGALTFDYWVDKDRWVHEVERPRRPEPEPRRRPGTPEPEEGGEPPPAAGPAASTKNPRLQFELEAVARMDAAGFTERQIQDALGLKRSALARRLARVRGEEEG